MAAMSVGCGVFWELESGTNCGADVTPLYLHLHFYFCVESLHLDIIMMFKKKHEKSKCKQGHRFMLLVSYISLVDIKQ